MENINACFQSTPLVDNAPRNVTAHQPDCADYPAHASERQSRAKPFLDYLRLINGGSLRGEYRFRCLKTGAPTKELRLPTASHDQLEHAFNDLDALNQEAYNIFVLVNDGVGTKTADIRACHCVFADYDGEGPTPAEAMLAQVKALNPTAIVHTSRGKFHAYWQVSGIAIDQFSDVQKAIIRTLGTDKAIHDVTRIMRVPGFSHVKDPTNPQPVTLEMFQDAPVLSLADLDAKFGPISQEDRAAPATGTVRRAGAIDPNLLVSLKAALPFIPNSEYNIWLQVGMALEFEGAPIELWKEWSSSDSSYDEAVCDSKWESFSQADGEVVTAKTIFHLAQENGWTNDGRWAQPELDQAQDRLLAAIAALDTNLTQSDDTKRMALARADADYHEAVGVLDAQRQRRDVSKNEHEMGVRNAKAVRGEAQRQAENDRLAAVRVIYNEGLKLLDDHAAALVALKRQSSTAFSAIQARLLVVTGLGKRDLDRAIRQAEVNARAAGNVDEARSLFLRGYALLTNENLFADLSTGSAYSAPVFAQIAEKAFPNQWEEPLPLALARIGGEQLSQDTYLPGKPRIVENESPLGIMERMLNVYNAPVLPEPAHDAAKEKLLVDHIEYLSGHDLVFAEYLLNWMAFQIQRPGERINSAPLIIGPKGNGKSFLGSLMTALLGASNACTVTTAELAGSFQDDFVFKQVRIVEEIRVMENQAALMEALKIWITNDKVPCNRKNRSKVTVDNVGNWIFFSNHEDAMRFDADERRYAVAISRELRKPDEYYGVLFRTFIPKEGGSVASVLHLLKNRDLSSFNPFAPAPRTAARDEMLDQLKSGADRRVSQLLAQKDKTDTAWGSKELITMAEWHRVVMDSQPVSGQFEKPLSNAALARMAKTAGLVSLGQKRSGADRVKTTVFALRNAEFWLAASEQAIKDHFAGQLKLEPWEVLAPKP